MSGFGHVEGTGRSFVPFVGVEWFLQAIFLCVGVRFQGSICRSVKVFEMCSEASRYSNRDNGWISK